MPANKETYVVIGPNANKDQAIAGILFERGVAEVVVAAERREYLDRHLSAYQAYRAPEPLQSALAALLKAHPDRVDFVQRIAGLGLTLEEMIQELTKEKEDATADQSANTGNPVPDGGAGPEVQDNSGAAPDDGRVADAGAEQGNPGVEATDPNGAGTQDPVNADGTINADSGVIDPIVLALGKLDPTNDDHWTQNGLPKVPAVEAALGGEVTRAQIEQALPGFNRTAAAERRA